MLTPIMQFRVTAAHIKRQNVKSVLSALFLTVLCVACVGMLLSAKSLSNIIFPVIGLSWLAPTIFRICKIIKEGIDSYPVLELNENAGKISVFHKDVVVMVDIAKIRNLRLQYKANALTSIIVTTNSGEVMRFEGYENLDALASALKRFAPADRITNAKLYHR